MGTSNRNPKSFHTLNHAFYVHGKRFLAHSMDGVPNKNLAWKHTGMMIMFEVVFNEKAQ